MAQRSNAKAASPTVEFPPRLSSGYYLVRDAHRTFQRLLERRIAPYGVLSQRELSARVGMMEPTNVIAWPSMEKAGLVVRMREEGDRRKMRVLLTAKAKRLRSELSRRCAQHHRRGASGHRHARPVLLPPRYRAHDREFRSYRAVISPIAVVIATEHNILEYHHPRGVSGAANAGSGPRSHRNDRLQALARADLKFPRG